MLTVLIAAPLQTVALGATHAPSAGEVSAHNTSLVVNVSGNHLVNGTGHRLVLRGVNEAGLESQCETGSGIFDPATMDGSSAQQNLAASSIASWHANAVRLTLNEGCWLDLYTTSNDPCVTGLECPANTNPVPYEGAAYRSAVEGYVSVLEQHGLYVILTLAHGAPTNAAGRLLPGSFSTDQGGLPLPDSSSVPFWTSVATAFRTNRGVIFDLYGEPFPAGNSDSSAAWSCWLNGCRVSYSYTYTDAETHESVSQSESYAGVGMQALVHAVRVANAHQPLLLGGVRYSGVFSENGVNTGAGWLTAASHLTSPGAIIADLHTYACDSPVVDGECQTNGHGNNSYESACITPTCWHGQVATTGAGASTTVADHYPVIIGEFGDYACDGTYPDQLMTYADGVQLSYLAWTWNPGWSCSSGPSLVTTLSGTPTRYGAAVKAHLLTFP